MTTGESPMWQLRAQAEEMAARLKAMERGDPAVMDAAGRVAAARERPSITFAVVMDDKTLKVEMTWVAIRDLSEAAIAEFILKQMRNKRANSH